MFMTTKINTYEDLLQEEQRLLLQLKAQKQLLRQDMAGIQEELRPVSAVFSLINKTLTRDAGSWLMNSVAGKTIDVVFKKILGRAGLLTKVVVPFLLKNYTSHFIADHKDEITGGIFNWVKKRFSANGRSKHDPEEAFSKT